MDIDDITWWRDDMTLCLSGKNNISERAQRTSDILFLPREHKIPYFELTCEVFFYYVDKTLQKRIEGTNRCTKSEVCKCSRTFHLQC